jgi:hypothetical protein
MFWNLADDMTDSLWSRWWKPSEPLTKQVGPEASEDRGILRLIIMFVMGAVERAVHALILSFLSEGRGTDKMEGR